jgi:hypothetical protein
MQKKSSSIKDRCFKTQIMLGLKISMLILFKMRFWISGKCLEIDISGERDTV